MDLRIILPVIVIIIIILLLLPAGSTDEDIRNRVNKIMNIKLSGEKLDGNVLNVIKKINKIKKKDAMDYYNMGTMYACHIDTPDARATAFNNYMDTLYSIHSGDVKERDTTSILYRLENILNKKDDPITVPHNYTAERHTFPDILRQRILPIINNEQKINHEKIIKKTKADKNKHTKKTQVQRKMTEKKVWKSDSQNVHDSAVLYDLKSQFNYIKTRNNIAECPKYSFEQVRDSILDLIAETESDVSNSRVHSGGLCSNSQINQTREDIKKVLHRISENSKVLGLNVSEKGFLIEIWRRIESPINIKNKKDLEQALIISLSDCIENGSVVCSTGRNTHMMSSLAVLDKDSKSKGIGILKSKEAIRNEIFDASAKIVEKYTGKNSKTSKITIEDYNVGKINDRVKELEENMKLEILKLKEKFMGRGLDETKINQALEECIAVI